MRRNLVWLLAAALLLAGCAAGLDVRTDFDRSVDFSRYRTFSFYGWDQDSSKILTPFDRERFEQGFKEEFARRGIKYVEQGGDLTVAIFVHTRDKTQVT
ncbi:MAG: DUF4136 domain-containing protein, partial [Deltaproteobacteria bacterium]|nr:DUF4136 domain-containing protein [Deltaproteobacteria bacterium]